jgi:hypothetical protein
MRLFGRSEGPEVLGELVVGLGEVREAAVEGLLAMNVAVGLEVMAEMMEEELTRRVGPKHAKLAGRRATRHASAPGSVVLGGRRIYVAHGRGVSMVLSFTLTAMVRFLTTTSSKMS